MREIFFVARQHKFKKLSGGKQTKALAYLYPELIFYMTVNVFFTSLFVQLHNNKTKQAGTKIKAIHLEFITIMYNKTRFCYVQ